jgi:hypothetical protein
MARIIDRFLHFFYTTYEILKIYYKDWFSMVYNNIAITVSYYAALVLMYLILVTLAGSFRAAVSKLFGDDTAEQLGFLSLNPLVHADLVGMFALLLLKIGWGKRVPVDPDRIQGRTRWLKLPIVMLSGMVVYIACAVIGVLALAYLKAPMQVFPGGTGVAISTPLTILLEFFVFLCIFLSLVELVVNGVYLCMLFIFCSNEYIVQNYLTTSWVLPLIIFVAFGSKIELALYSFITYLAKLVATFFFGA